tara:strand:- start:9330 stop:10355 length:1026 start_codon:yes stop_codon:yes gene_type:complete
MARAYSGREWKAILGIADVDAGSSAGAVGADTQDANTVTSSKAAFRVTNPVNDIAWDAAYQRAEIERAGYRGLRNDDIVNHYGSGSWTWDFDYPVDNEVALQNLMTLIYPTGYQGAANGILTIGSNPSVEDYSHGANSGNNRTGVILLENPHTDKDRYMHSAILQTLTFGLDAGTNGGRLNTSGQFMTGYKPVIEANTVTADTTATDYTKGLFDCTTHSFGGSTCTFKSFNMTIENPASRIGYQGSSGETDGYSRGQALKVTGTCSLKADTTVQAFMESKWQTNTAVAINVGNGSTIDFSIPAANISSWSMDQADEGIFVEVGWTATAGSGSGNLAVITCT